MLCLESRVLSLTVSATSGDERLIRRIAERDQEALGALYDRYGSLVYSLALTILRDAPEAEAVVQHTLLRVWQRAWEYQRERASVRTWLCAVARNRSIDVLRKRGRRQEAPLTELETAGQPATDSDAFARTFAGERRRLVLEALGEIPDEQRRAIYLAYYEGLSHRQVAERLEQPLGTIKTRIKLGLEKLRAKLAETGTG